MSKSTKIIIAVIILIVLVRILYPKLSKEQDVTEKPVETGIETEVPVESTDIPTEAPVTEEPVPTVTNNSKDSQGEDAPEYIDDSAITEMEPSDDLDYVGNEDYIAPDPNGRLTEEEERKISG